jgi:hypothetical protein
MSDRKAILTELAAAGLITADDAAALDVEGGLGGAVSYADVGQGSAVADASGGATVDAEARTAINGLLAQLRTLGIIAT